MNCKGSPYSQASTGLTVSPNHKIKLSRKFRINLAEEEHTIQTNNNENLILQKKLLRYRRKCRDKQNKYKEFRINNELLLQDFNQSQINIEKLKIEFNEQVTRNKDYIKINSATVKNIEDIKNQIEQAKTKIKVENGSPATSLDLRPSCSAFQLEVLQEQLFVSNKKVNDLDISYFNCK